MICLPGWPQTWYSYHPVAMQLAKAYWVIIIDLRGMGSSEKPESGYDWRFRWKLPPLNGGSACCSGNHIFGGLTPTTYVWYY
ncbi:MAG: alpha/beta fold hydrolase, partial [Janthinobacterium lividum]